MDKDFILNSIRMDLLRVVNMGARIDHKFPKESIETFLDHADKEFGKVRLTGLQKLLRKEMRSLRTQLDSISDSPSKRLKWSEKILTIRSRL